MITLPYISFCSTPNCSFQSKLSRRKAATSLYLFTLDQQGTFLLSLLPGGVGWSGANLPSCGGSLGAVTSDEGIVVPTMD